MNGAWYTGKIAVDIDKLNNLLDRVGNKDKAAFEEIYNEYCKKIKWTIFNVVKDWFYVEDILDEVFIKIWNNAHKLKIKKSPDAWIHLVAKHTALDFYKVHIKKHKKCIEFEEVSHKELKFVSYTQNFHHLELATLLQSLDDIDREIIILKIVYDFTHKEIAEQMKIPLGTILWRYQRSIHKIEEEITAEKKVLI